MPLAELEADDLRCSAVTVVTARIGSVQGTEQSVWIPDHLELLMDFGRVDSPEKQGRATNQDLGPDTARWRKARGATRVKSEKLLLQAFEIFPHILKCKFNTV